MANVIVNGQFNSSTGWTLSPRATIIGSGGFLSSACLQCANNSVGGAVDASQMVTLTPGKSYALRWSAKRSGRFDTWGAHAFYTPAGQYEFFNGPSLEGRLINNTYVQLAYYFTLPSAVRDNQVWVYVRTGADASDGATSIYIDEVSLEGNGSNTPPGPVPTAVKAFRGSCIGTGVNVRKGPSTNDAIYAGLSYGSSEDVYTFKNVGTVDQQRSWLAFQWSDFEYVYVYARYMAMNPSGSGALNVGPRAKVTATDVNLRELPNTTATIIKNLGNGIKMIVLDNNSVSGWWRVVTDYGTGWVSSQYVAYE